jgi:hypothetical protein
MKVQDKAYGSGFKEYPLFVSGDTSVWLLINNKYRFADLQGY